MNSKENPKKIILVDDHFLVRKGLKELIGKLGNYRITDEFDNGKELLDALPSIAADLIILDISMPELNGRETLIELKRLRNEIPVLILTEYDDDLQAIKVFRLGARGYLRKNCKPSDLTQAFSQIFASGYYHNHYFDQSIAFEGVIPTDKKSEKDRILKSLTEKERNLLKWVASEHEYEYKEIAEKMCITERAVDKCREDLFIKFKIKSKAGLVIFFYRNDLYDSL